MSVLNRPMFRQAGGPAAPMPQDMAPPMPQDMAPPMPPPMASEMAGPPPEIAMLEQAEAGAMAQGQELGAAYAQQMMAGIDGAQSTEDLINALRGNEMTLGDRRDELAEYVGQSDADKTPESVLAMVQPVIMMTEEGMMNSGIGALVQQIAGDVDMATEGGQPTDMGMGVGSLMMAGAQEAPAPQNFRQGGEVAYLSAGTPSMGIDFRPSEVLRQYDALLPLFEKITSDTERAAEAEEQKKMDELQFLLSAARGGLRLAAGDPKAGSSFASQVGAAFEPTAAEMAALGAAAQKRRTDLRAEDRALRSADLQGAMNIETQSAKGRQDLLLAMARDPKNASFEFLYKDGDTKAVDLRGGQKAVDEVERLLSEGWTDRPPPEEKGLGGTARARAFTLLGTQSGVESLENYFAGDASDASFEAANAFSIVSAPTIDPITRRESAAVVPEYLLAAKARGEARRGGEEQVAMPTPQTSEQPIATGTTPESTKGATGTFFDDVPEAKGKTEPLNYKELTQIGIVDPEKLTGEAREAYYANLEKGTGLPSGPVAFAEYLVAQGSDILNIPLSDPGLQGNPRARDARKVLRGIQQRIENFILADQNRPLSAELERIYQQLPEPSMFTDDEDMYRSIEKWRNYVADEVLFSQEVIKRGEDYAKAEKTTVNNALNRRDRALTMVLPLLNAALDSYSKRSGGVGMSDAQKAQRRPLSELRRRGS